MSIPSHNIGRSEDITPAMGVRQSQDVETEKDCKIKGVSSRIEHSPTGKQGAVSLKGVSPKDEEAEKISLHLELCEELKKLPPEEQARIKEFCISAYQDSTRAYEKELSSVLLNNPDAHAFASQLCRRMGKLVEAFRKVEKSKNPPQTSTDELKDVLAFARFFGNSATGSGSVGFNPLRIQKTIENGSLREQMTLCYCTVFSFLLNDILKNPDTIKSVNEQLKEMNAGFQLDIDLIEKERREIGTLIQPIERVSEFRNGGRIFKEKISEGIDQGFKVSEVEGLTFHEMQAALEDYDVTEAEFEAMQRGEASGKKLGERRLRWKSGGDYFSINPEADFVKETKRLGLDPSSMIAGPSGTTDGFLHVSKYLGLENSMKEGTMALIGWMVPTNDHSLHEILVCANEYGIPYNGEPEDFNHLFEAELMNQVKHGLQEKGYQMPSYYLSAVHQHQAAKELHI